VHANGDAAIDTTIEAFETVLREMPRADHEHHIEHCSVLHPEQINKIAELGLSPSFLIGHVRWCVKAFRDRILGLERAELLKLCKILAKLVDKRSSLVERSACGFLIEQGSNAVVFLRDRAEIDRGHGPPSVHEARLGPPEQPSYSYCTSGRAADHGPGHNV
jgi:hypothetical protein